MIAAWRCRLPADASRRDPTTRSPGGSPRRSRSRPRSSSPLPSSRIIALAMQPAPDVWQHSDQIRAAAQRCSTPRCCSAASARLSLAIGTGTAWPISLHDFPRPRRCCSGCCRCRSRSRPISRLTSMSICSSRSAWSTSTLALWLPLQDAVRTASQSALAARRDHRDRAGALPLRLSLGAHDVPVPERGVRRGREDARRRPLDHLLAHLAADGAAGARGRRSRWCRWKR